MGGAEADRKKCAFAERALAICHRGPKAHKCMLIIAVGIKGASSGDFCIKSLGPVHTDLHRKKKKYQSYQVYLPSS